MRRTAKSKRAAVCLLLVGHGTATSLPALHASKFNRQSTPPLHKAPWSLSSDLASSSSSTSLSSHDDLDVTDLTLEFARVEANQSLTLNPDAMHALAALPAPLCVLSVTGSARDGKSTFLNLYAEWVRGRWDSGAVHRRRRRSSTPDFEVGHDLDTCTQGSSVTLLSGQGEPLPGTTCNSVALLDTQGMTAADGEGLHKLFTLALFASSLTLINAMRQFNDDTLERLAAAAGYARSALSDGSSGSDAPGLVVLLRDARLKLALSGMPLSADGSLYAALQPSGDALDPTRAAVAALFGNRSLLQMRQPDAADLQLLAERGSLAGSLAEGRPFYQSFVAVAESTTSALSPKSVAGVPVSGALLAAALQRGAESLNAAIPYSLQGALSSELQSRAELAVAAARERFVSLLPELRPRQGSEEDERPQDERPPSLAELDGVSTALALSPAALDFSSATALSREAQRNATEDALETFARLAPRFGDSSWLHPYFEQLRLWLASVDVQLSQAREYVARLEEISGEAARAEQRLRSELHAEMQAEMHEMTLRLEREMHATAAASHAAESSSCFEWLQEFALNVALLASAASAAMVPPGVMGKLAPLLRSTPSLFAAAGLLHQLRRSLGGTARAAAGSVRKHLPRLLHRLSRQGGGQAFSSEEARAPRSEPSA